VLVGSDTDPQVQMRLGRVGLGARPDHPDRVALGDHPALVDEQRAELGVRDRVPVPRPDRHDQAVAWRRPRERHRSRGCRAHRLAHGASEVDAAMLAAGVRVVAERERAQNGPVDGPRPCLCRRCGEREPDRDERQDSHRESTSCCLF
jgi:hypothetical protein